MTLQQLRYLIAIAEYGSINAAATHMYASQSNLSTAIKDLESELGISIFRRSNRGVTLTNDGTELLNYARQVVEQADLLEARYKQAESDGARLAVSTQHYSFSVEAFIRTAEECKSAEFEFILRETATAQIIRDVKEFRSEIGIVYTDGFNSRAMWRAFDDARLMFHPLFEAPIHVFVNERHPLAKRKSVSPGDLADYPRYSFEQGADNSFFFSEEPLAYLPHKRNIRITDRGTLTNLLQSYDGYTLSTGLLSPEMRSGVAALPLDTDETMKVGYLVHQGRQPDWLLHSYIANLKKIVNASDHITSYVD
ncbi:LysR family transcriptional regulator [Curtanaerobium respiraculi]|uniref:LysR family transcriptional regulator n=1 Tax=Curtanaerobium respiraculi TaxID=2949669 RepID=UPI0024B330E4|nr:LysR family transcriptional regulator [Curtanaerobium respiraculi]